MAYNPNIPQATDTLNSSQGDLLANFMAIQTLIDVNHYDFASANQGKHMFVTMPVQTQSPGTALGEMALFTMNDGSGTPQLWLQAQNQASAGPAVNFTTYNTTLANGGTNLPSGIVLKWGQGTTTGGVQAVTFTTAFPTALLCIQGTLATTAGAAGAGSNLRIYSYTRTGFSVNTGANAAYCWFAIGY
jgi:hypothetical protein